MAGLMLGAEILPNGFLTNSDGKICQQIEQNLWKGASRIIIVVVDEFGIIV